MKLGVSVTLVVFITINTYAQDTLIHLPKVEITDVKPSNNYAISAIDSSILESNSAASLDEVLNKASDIFVKDYGAGALSTVSFRGMGSSHTKIYWNGISLNSGMNGTFDLSLFSINSSDNIDIHYGASSLIDGSGSLGGSVNLNNAGSFGKGTNVFLSQSLGSFSTYKTLGKISLSEKKVFLNFRMAYSTSKNDFEYLNPSKTNTPKEVMQGANYYNTNAIINAGWLVNSKNSIKIYFIHQQSNRNLPKLNVQESVGESQQDATSLGFVEWGRFGRKIYNTLKLGGKMLELNYQNQNIQLDSKSNEKSFFVQDRLKYKLLKKINSSSSFLYDYIESYNEKYGSVKLRNELQMIQDFQYNVSKKAKAGILLKTHITDNIALPFLPSANFGYKAIKNWMKISASVSYHGAIPTMNDLYWGEGGNPNLKPEEGISTELNFTGKKTVENTGFNYRASGYYSDISNWILWSPDASGIWRVSNVGQVKSYGADLNVGIRKEISKSYLNANVAYNWNVSKDQRNNQLLYVPIHRVRVNIGWKWKSLSANYNHQFTDVRFINSRNTAWLPSYFLADFSCSYLWKIKYKNEIKTAFKINNLYNEPFQSVANRPMPGRYFTITLSYKWK